MENGSPGADEAEKELASPRSLSAYRGSGRLVPFPNIQELSLDNWDLGPERVYDCKTCSRRFRSSEAVGRHSKTCRMRFWSSKVLGWHRTRHTRRREGLFMFSDPAAAPAPAPKKDRARVVREVDPDRRGQRELLPSSSQQGVLTNNNIAGYGTSATATGGDLDAGLGGAAPDKQPSENVHSQVAKVIWLPGELPAEYSYFLRPRRDAEWETCVPVIDDCSWKQIAEPVMKTYTETTDGSAIENKETALVWCYEDVKVKPQGVCKGLVAKRILSTMQEDFVLWAGDDLEAGLGGAAPDKQPSVNEEEEDKTLKHFFIQLHATLLPASAMAYPVLKDAPKHVKIVIFGGLLVVSTIVLFAGILSRSLARRWLGFWLVSCAALALLTFSFASQLS